MSSLNRLLSISFMHELKINLWLLTETNINKTDVKRINPLIKTQRKGVDKIIEDNKIEYAFFPDIMIEYNFRKFNDYVIDDKPLWYSWRWS